MLAKTPPMGFNTWNTFGSEINESMILESADAMIDLGLLDAGYEYLVIDDCWSEYLRDPVTQRLVAHHEKFPNGMKAVADYVHSKGLKFGMYSCCGVRTCGDYPGSFDHEFLDAQTFAEFGVDYLKYDNCFHPTSVDGPTLYRRMGMALRATGRDILFSACNWGEEDVQSWIRSSGAHMYRSTGDIFDNAQSYRSIAVSQMNRLAASAPGCFNDLDMLTVGMYGKGLVGTTGCTDADYRSQFATWCMFSSPLMLGCDVRSMSPTIHDLVTNPRLIRINQDEEARPPFFLQHRYGCHDEDRFVCFKFLSRGQYALGFFNLSEEDQELFIMFADAGLETSSGLGLRLQDAFSGEDAGFYQEYYRVKVPAHDCAVYLGTLEKA